MDSMDQAAELEELDRSLALSRRAPAGPAAKGECYFCEEKLTDDRRWCDAECRDEWQKMTRRAA